jgi:hypothetical protein
MRLQLSKLYLTILLKENMIAEASKVAREPQGPAEHNWNTGGLLYNHCPVYRQITFSNREA